MSEVIRVAVGVLRNAKGEILLARRPDHVHQGGLWEFPGGKIEASETRLQALKRELWEELAIDLVEAQPLIQVRHCYGDRQVLLDVWEVDAFHGTPRGNEGQPLVWVAPHQLVTDEYPLPAANVPISKALQIPDCLLITGAAASADDFSTRLQGALDAGVKLVQLRLEGGWAESLSSSQRSDLAKQALSLCRSAGARLVVNEKLGLEAGLADGCHLPAEALMGLSERPADKGGIIGASCHSEAELAHAQALNLDYVLLSPVSQSDSHPNPRPLGWDGFRELTQKVNLPVYALGGMSVADIPNARACGGRGIAGISALWRADRAAI